jgi:hypothetical protein
MKIILKYITLFSFLLVLSCSTDDDNGDDRPFCSEYNAQNPSDEFVPCENEESPCKCG